MNVIFDLVDVVHRCTAAELSRLTFITLRLQDAERMTAAKERRI